MLEKLSMILPITILMGSLVDTILVVIYMKFVHPWRDILSSKEDNLTPQLKSEMDCPVEPSSKSLKSATKLSNELSHTLSHVESNIRLTATEETKC